MQSSILDIALEVWFLYVVTLKNNFILVKLDQKIEV